MNSKRSLDNLSNILDMSNKDAKDLLIYYNSKHLNTKIDIQKFVNFVLYDVANDIDYKDELSNETLEDLKDLERFTIEDNINKEMNLKELSDMFDIDEDKMDKLLMYYYANSDSNTKLKLYDFASFALDLKDKKDYKDLFNKKTINSLELLKTLSDDKYINKDRSFNKMKDILKDLGFDLENDKLKLLFMYYMGNNTNNKITLNDFANDGLSMANGEFSSYFDDDAKDGLQFIKDLNIKYDTVLTNAELYDLFKVSQTKQIGLNYTITHDPNGIYQMKPTNFVQMLLYTPELRATLEEDEEHDLKLAETIINNINTLYNRKDLAKDLEQDQTIVDVIYGYHLQNNNGYDDISIKDLISFIYDNRKNDLLKDKLKNSNELELANEIVNNTNTKYKAKEISKLIDKDKDDINKIFGLYDYENGKVSVKPIDLTHLIIENKKDKLLSDEISEDKFDKLELVDEVMTSSLSKRKYNAIELSDLLDSDLDKLKLLLSLFDYKYIKSNQSVSLYNFVNFIIDNVLNNDDYKDRIDNDKKEKLLTIRKIMNSSKNNTKYTSKDAFVLLGVLSDDLDSKLVDLVYIYQGSKYQYDDNWKLTIEELVNYINDDILNDPTFDDYIKDDKRNDIINAKKDVLKAKDLIVSDKYSRMVLNTKYSYEGEDTYEFINKLETDLGSHDGIYVSGHSSMAVEMSKTFNEELDRITILTMIFIFIVVAITFKDLIIPFVLVLIIQCAVYVTMSFISITGGSVYFISLLIVQAILMGATIDYAIVYTAYYKESRLKMGIKESIINAYNKSIHTIISSSSILIIVTLVVANFASAIAAKICETISQGTLASVILILVLLPGILSACDRLICRKQYVKKK